MFTLSAKVRKNVGKGLKILRKKEILPAVLYGPKIKKSLPLKIDQKEFEKVYKEVGESGLISLKVEDKKKSFSVLIHDVQYDPLTDKPIHVDFYQPLLKEEVQVEIPIIFEGEAPAVKGLGGTFIKNISEVEIKGLPQNLPKEIKVNIEVLKTFEDLILIKDLKIPEGIKILRDPEEIVAQVVPPEKLEEELKKPVAAPGEPLPKEEEKVKEVEGVGEKKE